MGYDLAPAQPRAGQATRLAIYYAATAPVQKQFTAALSLSDILGRPWGDFAQLPVTIYDPTYFWKPGEYYRDVWDFAWPENAPSGLYNAHLSWYEYDPTTNATDYSHEYAVDLPLRVGDFSAGTPQHSQPARLGDAIQFLGYDLVTIDATRNIVHANEKLTIALYWQPTAPVEKSYTVFVHLLDAQNRVVAQSDSPPWGGMYPTDRWTPGETVRDVYILTLGENLAAGDYRVEVGMYLPPDKRLRVQTDSGESDRVLLETVVQVVR
jgi:hypothetical protein